MSGNPNLDEKIKEWLKWDKNEHSLESINQMLDAKHFDQLAKLLLHRLTFGTAGIRGRMQPGYAGMNDLVIIQTGQGLVKYLEQYEKDLLEQNGIVIGYDGRHNSKRYTKCTKLILLFYCLFFIFALVFLISRLLHKHHHKSKYSPHHKISIYFSFF